MDVRDKILLAAVTVFAEVGFRGATTRRIAQEAGVNEITLFRHFGSKDRLLHEAISRSDLAPTPPALPSEPRRPRAELLAWVKEHYEHLVQRRSLICTCLAEMSEHPEIIPPNNPTALAVEQLGDYLRKLRSAGFTNVTFDAEIAAPMLLGVLFSDAMGREFAPGAYPKEPDKTLEGYVDFFLRGLGVEKHAAGIRQEKAS